jgi:hypothetical protein
MYKERPDADGIESIVLIKVDGQWKVHLEGK